MFYTPARRTGDEVLRRPSDDVPSAHSSMSNIVPFIDGEPAATETVWSRSKPAGQPFRDAQEYQGRAQGITVDGSPSLPPADGYRTARGDNLEQ